MSATQTKRHGNVVATAATLRMIKVILRRTLAPSLAFPPREHDTASKAADERNGRAPLELLDVS